MEALINSHYWENNFYPLIEVSVSLRIKDMRYQRMINGDSGKSFLECPLIRDFNVFVRFRSPVLGPLINTVFLE